MSFVWEPATWGFQRFLLKKQISKSWWWIRAGKAEPKIKVFRKAHLGWTSRDCHSQRLLACCV